MLKIFLLWYSNLYVILGATTILCKPVEAMRKQVALKIVIKSAMSFAIWYSVSVGTLLPIFQIFKIIIIKLTWFGGFFFCT